MRRHSRTRLPGTLLATVVLAVGLLVGDFALAHIVAPQLLNGVAIGHLRKTLDLIALFAFVVVFLAAFAAGLLGGARGIRRGVERRWANLAGVLFGCALVPAGLFAYALIEKAPISTRPTQINLAMIAAGAIAGWLISELRRRSLARPQRPLSGSQIASTALMLTMTASGFSPLPPTARPPVASFQSIAIGQADIEQTECVLVSTEEGGQVEVAIVGITLGSSFAYKETEHADKTWEAEVTAGAQGGLTLGVGQHIGAKLLAGAGLGEGLSLTLKALGDFERVNTYGLHSKPTADATLKLTLVNFLDSVVMMPGLNQVSGQSTLASFLDQYQDEYPSQTDISLAGKLTLSVDAGALSLFTADMTLGAGAGVTLHDEQHAGTDHYYVNNPSSVDIYINLSGEGQAGLSQLGASAGGEAVLSMAIAPKSDAVPWVPTSVTVEGTLEGSISGVGVTSWDQETAGLPTQLHDAAKAISDKLDLGLSSWVGLKLSMTQKLDLNTHPQDAALLLAYFDAYQKALDKNATQVDYNNLDAASKAFAQAFLRDADGEFFVYFTNRKEVSVSFQMGTVFVDGASAGVDGTTEQLALAFYKTDSGEWAPSTACVGSLPFSLP